MPPSCPASKSNIRGALKLYNQLERDFDSHLQHILHLDDLLARDARHQIQLGYPVLNYPRYIPTTVELCRSSFTDIMDKIKDDLVYFKDDFQNEEMFKAISR